MENREIKFRAWDGDRMYYQSENTASCMNGLERFTQVCGAVRGRTPDVMQYTGLKDADGVEIYEGDIVRSSGCLNEDLGEYKVAWHDGHFRCECLDSQYWHCHLDQGEIDALNLVVIGNIHENADLLPPPAAQ